jgi:hypothetical protein
MRYGLDGRGLIPGVGKIFLFSTESRLALRPTQPPVQWVLGVMVLGIKQKGYEADLSPPYSSDVKNGGAIFPFPHMSAWHCA